MRTARMRTAFQNPFYLCSIMPHICLPSHSICRWLNNNYASSQPNIEYIFPIDINIIIPIWHSIIKLNSKIPTIQPHEKWANSISSQPSTAFVGFDYAVHSRTRLNSVSNINLEWHGSVDAFCYSSLLYSALWYSNNVMHQRQSDTTECEQQQHQQQTTHEQKRTQKIYNNEEKMLSRFK